MAVAKKSSATTKRQKPAAKQPESPSKLAALRANSTDGARRHVGSFMDFIREQGIIGLAVGLAIGTVASGTVRALVDGFINPIVQFVVGSQKGLEAATWHVHLWGRNADFKWGAAVSSLITLIATALIVYFIIHGAKLDRLDKKS